MSTNLSKAFKSLRKQGLIARQNFSCCQGCAGYAIAEDVTKLIDGGRDRNLVRGCVFYHKQSGDNKKDGLDFYLNFGCVDTAKYGPIGPDAKTVGETVAAALAEAGVLYSWDGEPGTGIRIRNNFTLKKYVERDGVDLELFVRVDVATQTSTVRVGYNMTASWVADSPVSGFGYKAWETGEVGPMLDYIQENYREQYEKAVDDSR